VSDPSVHELLTKAQGGSHSAVLALLETCSPRILKSIRRGLTQRMRRRLDSEDVAQAVWASFFRGPLEPDKFADLADLEAYVERMAANKVADVNRAQRRHRRDVGRDVGLDSQLAEQLAANQPTPSQVLSGEEEYGRLLNPRSERHRRILEMRAEGATFDQIGEALKLHPGSVRRVVAKYAPPSHPDSTS
jgi:RNA polymerase sigma factor (sigma-70 family)